MTIVDGDFHDESATETPAAPAVRLEVGPGAARVVLSGVLTAAVSAAARELLLDACELGAAAVVLDLQVVLDPADHDVLPHLVDVAQRRCWAARCRLDVTASDPEVCEALAAAGIWSSPPPVAG
jgi:anti-anti-sigma regulatory factor